MVMKNGHVEACGRETKKEACPIWQGVTHSPSTKKGSNQTPLKA